MNTLQKDGHWIHVQVLDRHSNKASFLVREARISEDQLAVRLFKNGIHGDSAFIDYPKDFFPVMTHAFIEDGSERLPGLLAEGVIQDFRHAPII